MKRLVYRPAALDDLRAITSYIAEDDPIRAESFVAELVAKASQIVDQPFGFPARDDLAPGLRAARHGRYLIFFTVADDEIQVVRVLHGARDLRRQFGA